MKISGLYEVFFSPTGHTKKVIEVFSKAWNVPKTRIDLTNMNNEFDKYDIYSEDLCVFAVPSYCGRVPVTATQRINQLKGNNTPAIIISTYGNRDYEDTLCELQDIVEERGFYVVAALAVPTEHSIVTEIAKGRIDEQDIEKLTAMAIAIREYITKEDGFNCSKLNGNETYRELKQLGLAPVIQGKCLDCGICAKNCPVGAIPLDSAKETDESKCISCMRCVAYCPSKSRIVPKIKLSPIVNKLKKECIERKEIEIFINSNTGNSLSAMEAYAANKIKNKQEELEQVNDMLENESVEEENVLSQFNEMSDLGAVLEESILPPLDEMPELNSVVEESILPPLDEIPELNSVVEESILPPLDEMPELNQMVEENILPSLEDMPELGPVIEEIKKTEEIKKNSDFGAFDDLVLEPLPEVNKTITEEKNSDKVVENNTTMDENAFDEPEFEINGAPVDEGPVKIEIPQDKILPPPTVEEEKQPEQPKHVVEPDLKIETENLIELEPIVEHESEEVKEEKPVFEFKMADLVSLVNETQNNDNEDEKETEGIKENIEQENNNQEQESNQVEAQEESKPITQMNFEEMMQLQDIEPPKPREEDKNEDIENVESAADSLFDF